MGPDRRRPRIGPAALPVALVVGAVASMALVAASPVVVVADVAFLAGYACCTALAWVGVARNRPEARGPWAWVAAGATLTMVGDALFEVVLGAPPGATVADLLWIPSYACLAVALLRLQPLGIARRRVDVDALVDSLVALVVGVLVAWEVAIEGVAVAPGPSTLDRIVTGTYPILDVVLLALVVRLLLGGTRSRPLARLAAGTVVLLVADLVYALDAAGTADDLISVFWMVALLLLTSSTIPVADDAAGPAERMRVWLALAPIGAPIGFLLWGQVTHDHPNPGLVLGCTLALLVLAGWRASRLIGAVEEARTVAQARERRFRALTANAADAVVVADVDGVVKQGAESLAALLDVDAGLFEGTPTIDNELVVDPEAVLQVLARSQQAPGVVFDLETEVRHPDGSRRWMEARVANLLDDPVVGGIVVNVRDVTERRRVSDELRRRAFHDPLTGVANRALLHDRLEHAMRRGGRRGVDPAIVHVDLDGFKARKDRYGTTVGDALLRAVAQRLLGAARPEDTVARLADDEFAVLVEEDPAGSRPATTLAHRIVQALSAPFEVDGHRIALTASIGVAAGDPVMEPGDLLRHAEVAMRQAKAGGGAAVVEWSVDVEAGVEALRVLRGELPHALARGQIELCYEPVVRLADGVVLGAESHVCWDHPELGPVPADRLRALLDEGDAGAEVGRWALAQACLAAADWRAAGGHEAVTVGVNLSARHLASDQLVGDVDRALRAAGLPASALVLELGETTFMSDPTAIADRLRLVSERGVRLAMDRFGTGRSSLAHLRRLPLDVVKIDQTFTMTVAAGAPGVGDVPPIVRGLVELASRLGLAAVAEGVERPEQWDALLHAGCAAAQGPLVSPLLPAPAVARLVGPRAALGGRPAAP